MEMFYNDVEPLPSPDERQRFLREGLLSFADSSTSTNSTLNKVLYSSVFAGVILVSLLRKL